MNVHDFLAAIEAGEGEAAAGAYLDWAGQDDQHDWENQAYEDDYDAEDEAATDDDGACLSDEEFSMRPQRAKPEPYAPADDDSIEHAHWKLVAWTEYSRKRPELIEPVE